MVAEIPGETAKSTRTGRERASTRTSLRRISRGSLSALAASRNRDTEDDAPPLEFLSGAFAELSEGLADLALNFEALDTVNESLYAINEGLAALIYGMRMNVYTSELYNAPTQFSFERAVLRAEKAAREEEDRQSTPADEADTTGRPSSDAQSHSSGTNQYQADATFVSQRDDGDQALLGKAGRPSAVPKSRVPSGKSTAQKKKEAMIRFAHPIIATLPIQYREQQPHRTDAETVIGALRQSAEGLRRGHLYTCTIVSHLKLIPMSAVPELVKAFPLIPKHRLNDTLLSLVRAKQAIKITNKGTVYRLDPLKYPPP